jgi:hypothetical protein
MKKSTLVTDFEKIELCFSKRVFQTKKERFGEEIRV